MASRNRKAVPGAAEALNQFKFEVANEIGVPLKNGYNGDLTSYQNGSVGGYMVNTIYPKQHKKFLRMEHMRNITPIEVNYIYAVNFS